MSSESNPMRDFIETIVRSLVDDVEKIEIKEIPGAQTNVIELKVAKEDIGKVIGRSGRTAEAIRTLVNCGTAKQNKRYMLHIVDE